MRRGIDPASVFYFGESVLLPEYRGQGIGHAFFDHREAAARAWGASRASFCAVIRPPDHPARPAGYVPLDAFWAKRGYAPVPGLIGEFTWARARRERAKAPSRCNTGCARCDPLHHRRRAISDRPPGRLGGL